MGTLVLDHLSVRYSENLAEPEAWVMDHFVLSLLEPFDQRGRDRRGWPRRLAANHCRLRIYLHSAQESAMINFLATGIREDVRIGVRNVEGLQQKGSLSWAARKWACRGAS
jgi:hypothetical protein